MLLHEFSTLCHMSCCCQMLWNTRNMEVFRRQIEKICRMVREGAKQKCFSLRKSALVTDSALKITWCQWGSGLLLITGACPEGAIANWVPEDRACEPASLADQSLAQAKCHCPGVARCKGHQNPRNHTGENCDQKAECVPKSVEGKKEKKEAQVLAG